MFKQQLFKRKVNTPTNTSHVRRNCGSVTKQSCEVGTVLQNEKTLNNNPEENPLPRVQGGQVYVEQSTLPVIYVLSIKGEPLMPTSPMKARQLLKKGEAHVIKRKPFTIRLTKTSTKYRQHITLDVDSGYNHIGLSAKTTKKEVFSSAVALKTNGVQLLSERKMYRRIKRNKLWYRKARFLNRKKDFGWLAPSIQHKIDSHIRVIQLVQELLSITHVNIETASFDIQKIKNPDISGKEYQEGEQLGFYNTKAYVFHRDNYQCQHCKGKSKDKKLIAHHKVSRQTGGNRPDNLVALCVTCHDKFHKGEIELNVKISKGFKAETFMCIARKRLLTLIKESGLSITERFGYETKLNREKLGLEKSHINDAFAISGTTQIRCQPFFIKQRRRNNRGLQLNRKGFKPSIRKKRYTLQPLSLVEYNNEIFTVVGVQNKGDYVGLKKSREKKKFIVNIKKVKLIKFSEGFNYV